MVALEQLDILLVSGDMLARKIPSKTLSSESFTQAACTVLPPLHLTNHTLPCPAAISGYTYYQQEASDDVFKSRDPTLESPILCAVMNHITSTEIYIYYMLYCVHVTVKKFELSLNSKLIIQYRN